MVLFTERRLDPYGEHRHFLEGAFPDLEKADLHPVLINPRIFNRGSDKRKTDKSDATWLANLARLGLYRASFIPEEPYRSLRLVQSQIKSLVAERQRLKNRLVKVLGSSSKPPSLNDGGSRFV